MTPELLRAVFLGALQGATEFLPVSSSGHLVAVPALLGWEPPSLTFDVVVHLATALAVLLYFRDDWLRLAAGFARGLRHGSFATDPDARLALLLAVATIPAGLAGILLEEPLEAMFADPWLGAVTLVMTGILLIATERLKPTADSKEVDAGRALAIGVAQAVAIVPGISRSGATIAAGLALGLSREAATRFSFLMAAPVILGAGVLQLVHFLGGERPPEPALPLAAGAIVAFVVGYASIGWLLGYVRRRSLMPFGVYVIVFGLVAAWILR